MKTGYRRHDTDLRYLARLRLALRFLWANLDQDVSLERLAEVACFSPCHFHRIYRGLMGETVFDTVQRARLLRAARQLSHADLSLQQVARQAGYGSPAAFVRRFARHYGMSPGRYRAGVRRAPRFDLETFMQTVRIVTLDHPMTLLLRPHQGDYMRIGEAFDDLMLRGMPGCGSGESPRVFGLYDDDPDSVPVERLRSAAAMSWPADRPAPEGLVLWRLPAGRFAATRHTGPYNELTRSWRSLYREWLPQSGEEPADLPCIEEYLNNPRTTAPMALQTDLWIPLR
ncbi:MULTISPECIES: GyrI-like domain-containing protein [unclassified Paludibacterium]|uniref:AraC family transcriptional regulator n=1 Tax=unclassified Paludibacterium TaxID=2618429 RepID=UPI001C05566E|nr:AraC family transcriptional regulator [Paludibacterium sp. B53371]BEV73788.1 AraC family transcriptional regulator [Paludibacterium sp. THUN1379]